MINRTCATIYFTFSLLIVSCGNHRNNENGSVQSESTQYSFEFEVADTFSGGIAAVSKDRFNYAFINRQGQYVSDFIYDDPGINVNGLRLTSKEGLYGYIDSTGREVVPFEYNSLWPFENGIAFGYKDDYCGAVNLQGEEIIPFDFDTQLFSSEQTPPYRTSEGLITLEKGGIYGVFDALGKEVIPFKFEFLADFHEGLAQFTKDELTGYVNKKGEIVIPAQYGFNVRSDFYKGLVTVEKNDKYGMINQKGNVVIPLIYDSSPYLSEEMILVNKDDKIGFVDRQGKIVIPIIYEYAYPFKAGVALVSNGEKYAVINKLGELLSEFIYDPDPLEEDLSFGFFNAEEITGKRLRIVGMDNDYGCVDSLGNVVFEPIYNYSSIYHFINTSSGLVAMWRNDDLFGYVNQNGETVIPFRYEFGYDFINGFAAVQKDGRIGYLDENGKEIVPLEYDSNNYSDNMYFSNGLAFVKKDNKFGYVNTSGKLQIPLVFEMATPFSEGFAVVQFNEKMGFIDINGNSLSVK